MPETGAGNTGAPAATRWQMSTLYRIGLVSWSILGVVVLVVVAAGALAAVSGILVPLVVAIIIGTVLEPLVFFLEKRRVPAVLATVISLLVAVAVAAGTIAIVVVGFVQQIPEISRQLMVGWNSFLQWGRGLDLDAVLLERIRVAVYEYAPQVGQGVLGVVSSSVSGAISLAIGTFFALFFLFFVLRDSRNFGAWVARVARQDPEMVAEVDALAKDSLRGYFKGTALTAIITAPIFMIPLLLLGVPLAIPIFILYFFLSFIPYVGAWITGVFAILIAFGSGGATAALIVALSLLVSNGTIQSAVGSWALGSSLTMHPVTVLLATIIGGTIAGLLGMVLGPPVLAAITKSVAVIRARAALASPDAAAGAQGAPVH